MNISGQTHADSYVYTQFYTKGLACSCSCPWAYLSSCLHTCSDESMHRYGELNLSMRKKGGLHDKKLVKYGEYIYHLEEAIGACVKTCV